MGHLALQLRQKLQALFLRRMQCPTKPWSQVDEAVVRAVVGVLTSEEEALGLPKGPPGIGQRPRPFAFEPGYLSFSSPAVALPDNPAANPAGNPARRTVLRKGASLDYGTAARSLPSSRRGSGASLPAVPFGVGRSEAGKIKIRVSFFFPIL